MSAIQNPQTTEKQSDPPTTGNPVVHPHDPSNREMTEEERKEKLEREERDNKKKQK